MSNKKKSRLSFCLFICITAISLFLFTGCPDPIVAPTTETAGYFDVSLILVGSEGGVPYTKEVYFSETVNSVNIEVSNSLETVDIELLNEVSGAEIKVNNRSLDMSSKVSVSLDTGSNEISIKVSPGSVDPFYYTLVIKRQLPNGESFSSDAALSSLEISSVANSALQPAFSSDVFTYTATVGVAIAEIGITAVSSDDMAVIMLGDEVLTSGVETEPIAIVPGSNELEITVTAEDEITVNTYILTVNRIEDNDDPVITRLGDHPMNVEVFSIFNDPGCTAYDTTAGDLTNLIHAGGDAVDTSTLGTYTIIYTVSDAANNDAEPVYRTVHVVDTTPPVIEVTGEAAISVYPDGNPYYDLGATATDNYDDDAVLTSQIVTSGDTVNTSVEGLYYIYYDVTDSEGNDAEQKERLVRVTTEVDTEPPVITLLGSPEVTIDVFDEYIDAGATAVDNLDGDLTSIITSSGSVNSSVIGTYTISYDVYDTAGNDAETVARTVHVVDTEAPVISINGGNTIEVEYNTPFTDPEAVVSDNYDPDKTIQGSGSVNTLILGTYDWIYSTTDSSGNPASATLTVNVVDTTIPVITHPASDATIHIEYPGSYTELIPTATDNYDNNPVVVIGGDTVDTDILGTYVVTYNCTDSEGNTAAERTRTVIVEDTTAPVITLTGDNPITFEYGAAYAEQGFSVTDAYDDNAVLTASVSVDEPDMNQLGAQSITYSVTDSEGNTGSAERNLIIVDTTAPVFSSFNGTNPYYAEAGVAFSDPGAIFTDVADGELTVYSEDSVNIWTLGSQTISYTATDSSANTSDSVELDIIVQDTTPPVITLLGDVTPEIPFEGTFNDLGVDVSDIYDDHHSIPLSVVVGGDTVDTSIPGDYIITYNSADSTGNNAVQVTRTVTVLPPPDVTPPEITLNGDSHVYIEWDTEYVELGASASDDRDGDISADIIISGSVNNLVLGDYTIDYDVQDAAGNSAATVTRTVTVEDYEAPVITAGSGDPTIEVNTELSHYSHSYTAQDDYDGDITTDIELSGNVSVLGTQIISFDVSDSSGNEAVTLTREVEVVDTTVPVIVLSGSATIPYSTWAADQNACVIITDNYDTGLEPTITGSVSAGQPGTYVLIYDAYDNSGNKSAASITIFVVVPE